MKLITLKEQSQEEGPTPHSMGGESKRPTSSSSTHRERSATQEARLGARPVAESSDTSATTADPASWFCVPDRIRGKGTSHLARCSPRPPLPGACHHASTHTHTQMSS